MRRALAAASLALLALVPEAAASGDYARVLSSNGRVLASGTGQTFDYPADGSLAS